MDLKEQDIFWCTTDTGWVKAAWALFSAWHFGSCLFVHELPRADAKVILNVRDRNTSDVLRVNEMGGIEVLSSQWKSHD